VHAGQGDMRGLLGAEHDVLLMHVAERGQGSVGGRAALHIMRMRLARYGTLATPQLGQMKPLGQRNSSRYARQASSLENRSKNSVQVRG